MRLVVLAATLRQGRQRAKLWLLVEHTRLLCTKDADALRRETLRNWARGLRKSSRLANYFPKTATQT